MPKLIDCIQGSPEWFAVRCGKITASRINDVMAYLKSGKGEMACRRDYRMDLIAERLTGQMEDNIPPTRDMRWGIEQEPFARAMYEMAQDVMVEQIGFAIHPSMDYSGASPDSLVGSNGGLEIKCPKTTTHLAWMVARDVPEEHRLQMYWNMACCEREWWDFVSFDPRLPEELQLFCVRLLFDGATVGRIASEVSLLNEQIEEYIANLRRAA